MEPEIAPEKMRCVVVNQDLIVPGCICVPGPEILDIPQVQEEESDGEETEAHEVREEEPSKVSLEDEERGEGEEKVSSEEEKESLLEEELGLLEEPLSLLEEQGFEEEIQVNDMIESIWSEESENEFIELNKSKEIEAGRKEEIEGEEEEEVDIAKMSDKTREEGEIFEDYMRFYLEEPCDQVLSSISSSEISCVELILQRTVVIIKPEAMIYKEVILRAIFEAGFQIVGKRVIHLTPEQVSEIYAKHYGSPSFPHLVVTVSSGPVLVMSIAAQNAISKWMKMIGPDGSVKEECFFPISMRKRFGLQKSQPNSLHGSENLKESNRENRYFYPESILEPIITEKSHVIDYCNLYINPVLLNGLTEVVKKKPLDPILFLADWLLMNNPFQPRMPYKITLTPT